MKYEIGDVVTSTEGSISKIKIVGIVNEGRRPRYLAEILEMQTNLSWARIGDTTTVETDIIDRNYTPDAATINRKKTKEALGV